MDNDELKTLELNTNDKKDEKTTSPLLGEYFNIHSFKKHPITRNFIRQEAIRLKVWADEESSIRLNDFYDERGYSQSVFNDWVNHYPDFQAAHTYAKSRCGSRREKGALTRQFSENITKLTLAYYDPIVREQMIFAAQLRTPENENRDINITITDLSRPAPFEIYEDPIPSTETPEHLAQKLNKRTGRKAEVKVGARLKKD